MTEYNVHFKINDEEVTLCIPVDGTDHLFKMTNHDDYAVDYIINTINNGFISLNEPLKCIKRINDNGRETTIYLNGTTEIENNEPATEKQQTYEWTEPETVMLLELYEQFLVKIGPLKRFKTKKQMWKEISIILNNNFNTNKTPIQAENRYKTVLKRKKVAVENNNLSGSSRMMIPFEELNKISSLDDSIEPEVVGTARGIRILKEKINISSIESTSGCKTKKPKIKTIQETLLEIHEKKEENKERHHKEKLELIKQLFGNKED